MKNPKPVSTEDGRAMIAILAFTKPLTRQQIFDGFVPRLVPRQAEPRILNKLRRAGYIVRVRAGHVLTQKAFVEAILVPVNDGDAPDSGEFAVRLGPPRKLKSRLRK